MILDNEQLLSDAQALTASAASTNYIDLGADRDIGVGEPMALLVTCDVALAGTSPTLKVGVQTDSDSAFGSATTIAESQQVSSLAAGDKLVVPLPPANEQHLRAYYTLGGTSPTVTVSASIVPMSMIENRRDYASGFTVS